MTDTFATAGAWAAPLIIVAAGGFGGVINAMISGNGLISLPSTTGTTDGSVWRAGWMGNWAIGSAASFVSWAVYGTVADKAILDTSMGDLKYASIGAAVLVGMGGARWLSAEVDKGMAKQTAVIAARKDKNDKLADRIASSSTADGLAAAVAAES